LGETYRGAVAAWECDAFGHLNIAFYVERFADAARDLLERLAARARWRDRGIAVRYERELRAGEALVVRSAVAAIDEDGIRLRHETYTGGGARCTIAEHRLVPQGAMPAGIVPVAALLQKEDFPVLDIPSGAGPIASGRDRVKPWEIDDSGLSLLGHLHRFSNACLHVCDAIGMDGDYRRAAGRGFSTFETRLALVGTAPAAGEGLSLTSSILAVGNSSIRMLHRMHATGDGREIAHFHQGGVHFDLEQRRAAPWPAALRARAEALRTPSA